MTPLRLKGDKESYTKCFISPGKSGLSKSKPVQIVPITERHHVRCCNNDGTSCTEKFDNKCCREFEMIYLINKINMGPIDK